MRQLFFVSILYNTNKIFNNKLNVRILLTLLATIGRINLFLCIGFLVNTEVHTCHQLLLLVHNGGMKEKGK